MIVGSSGSGKSTLAKKLSEKAGIPVIHMDPFYWAPGWVLRSHNEIEALVRSAVSKEAWIIEGNNSSTFHLRSDRADLIILIDVPRLVCLWRVVLRSFLGKPRPDLPPGCPDRITWQLVKWVWGYPKQRLPKALKLIEERRGKVPGVRLRNTQEIEAFLQTFENENSLSSL